MLSDSELRAELVRLGANPGPITASTRSTYQKKLKQLLDANKTASNGYGQSRRPAGPSNGHEPDDGLTDTQLKGQLLQLGISSGPITAATRPLYLKKLARLRAAAATTTTSTTTAAAAAAAADVNGDGRPAAAGGGGARRRRLAPAREPEPESEPMTMDESDPMDESDSVGFSLDDSAAADACFSPVEYEFGGAADDRHDSPSVGYRPAGRSPMFDTDPPLQPTIDQHLYRPGRSSLFRDDPAQAPSPPGGSSLFRDTPAPAAGARSSVLREDDPVPAVQSRYRPELLSRARHYPETLTPRAATARPSVSLLSDRRPTPPPVPGRTAGSRPLDGGRSAVAGRAEPGPVTRAEPPPAERPGWLRRRVAAWCRPSPPQPPSNAADYDTCSDSEPDEPPPPGLTPSQQLQAFRRRMAASGGSTTALSDRGRTGYQAAPAHGASQLVPYCILLLAVLFFGVLVLSYLRLHRTDEAEGGGTRLEAVAEETSAAVAVFPICGDPAADERGCVSRDRLEPAVQLLSAVQPALVDAARDTLCGRRQLAAVPLTELAQLTGSTQDELRDVAVLVAYNSRLGLRTADGDGETSLSAAGVSTPWLCLAGAALAFIAQWVFTLLAVCVGFLVVRGLLLWRRRSRQRQRQQLYQMVENIMDAVRRHTLTAAAADKPSVAIDHVRDELLTPAERSCPDRMALWNRAVQFIREKESRVREECVMVAGESHTVWRWLPGTAGGGAGGGSRDRRRVWLGQAFQTTSGVNAPLHTRTNCLKIRHMFDTACEPAGSGWQQAVRDALLEKCDGLSVTHIAVDDRSIEGLVYVKCRTEADALNAFKRIQGCWFDGRLVSVKFIRLERYHERYPDAVGATEPMRPSNGLRRSLADLPVPAPAEDD